VAANVPPGRKKMPVVADADGMPENNTASEGKTRTSAHTERKGILFTFDLLFTFLE